MIARRFSAATPPDCACASERTPSQGTYSQVKYATFLALLWALTLGVVDAVFGSFLIGAVVGGLIGWLNGVRVINSGNSAAWFLDNHRGATFAIVVQAILLIALAAALT